MFIVNLLKAYSRFAIFATGILIGIQVPSFVDQYAKRIDAHYQEVSINISGFQKTADSLFDGDLEALITYYERLLSPCMSCLQRIKNSFRRH